VQCAEELVSWTGRERLRFPWYRLRLTVSEMNLAVRPMTELHMALAMTRLQTTLPPAPSRTI
jgi:hypothetical protein